jgi:hypothetical protein
MTKGLLTILSFFLGTTPKHYSSVEGGAGHGAKLLKQNNNNNNNNNNKSQSLEKSTWIVS